MAKSTKVPVRGTVYWTKIVGDKALVTNYDGDAREWTFELEPEDTSFLKEHRLLDRLKDPMAYAHRLRERGEDAKAEAAEKAAEGRGDYILLRRPEFNRDGEKNEPFKIYDFTGDEQVLWDDRLIGNGSKVDVILDIRDWGVGKKKSIYASAIRVTELVPYESDEFAAFGDAPAKTSEKKAKKPVSKTILEDLADDDLPFEL